VKCLAITRGLFMLGTLYASVVEQATTSRYITSSQKPTGVPILPKIVFFFVGLAIGNFMKGKVILQVESPKARKGRKRNSW
jgi:hypothetical protein